jgi:hypothetical protein
MRETYAFVVAAMLLGPPGLMAQPQSSPDRVASGRVVQLLQESGYRYTKETAWLWSVPFTGTKMARVSVWIMANDQELIIESVIARDEEVVAAPEVMRQLLIMNGAFYGDMMLLLDEAGNYVARARLIAERVDAPLFQAAIQAVIATTDEAYGAISGWLLTDAVRPPAVAGPAFGMQWK